MSIDLSQLSFLSALIATGLYCTLSTLSVRLLAKSLRQTSWWIHLNYTLAGLLTGAISSVPLLLMLNPVFTQDLLSIHILVPSGALTLSATILAMAVKLRKENGHNA